MTFNINRNYQIQNHQNPQIKRHQKIFDIFVCLIIRFIFMVQVFLSIYFLVDFYEQSFYLILTIFAIIIVIESYYAVRYRNGKEYTWYSISSIFYTIVIIVLIWRLVYTKIFDDKNKCEEVDGNHKNHHNNNKTNITENFSREKTYWLFVKF